MPFVDPELEAEATAVASDDRLRNRILLWCWTELDIASGTPVILCDLLDQFEPGAANVVCERNPYALQRRHCEIAHRVDRFGLHLRLWPFERGYRVRRTLLTLCLPLLIAYGMWRIRSHRAQHVIIILMDWRWILAGTIAARLMGVPVLYYVHDALLENIPQRSTLSRYWTAALERLCLSKAPVLVLHDTLAEHYRQRYGARTIVLRHQSRGAVCERHLPQPAPDAPLTIGFAGAIYGNNAECLRDLAAIVDAHPRLRLRLWTDASTSRLKAWGILREHVGLCYERDQSRLLEQLSQCDLLYLPLAFHDFDGMTRAALRFAFPTKTIDYLRAATPMLVHCPADYELARFAVRHRCGHVLSEPGSGPLAAWLEAWLQGDCESIDDGRRRDALATFSTNQHRATLAACLSRTCDPSAGAA